MVVLLLLAAPAESSRRASPSRDWAYALAIQKDGKLVAVGLTRAGLALARYTTKGDLDRTFANGGKVVAAGVGSGSAVTVDSDGKILAASWAFAGGNRTTGTLARYVARGTLDSRFGRGGKIATGFGVNAMAIQKDGRIIACGGGPIGSRFAALARYTPRGALDSSFGRGGKIQPSFCSAVALQADSKVVVAGTNVAHGSRGFGLARYNRDGTLDLSFGNGGKVVIGFGAALSPELSAVAIQPDGKIVAAGEAGFSDFALARFTSAGQLDPTFGDGGKVLTDFTPASNCDGCTKTEDSANALAIQRDGKIVAVGSSDLHGRCDDKGHSCDNFALARYDADSSLDPSFGSRGKVVTAFVRRPSHEPSSSRGEAVAIQKDGKLVVAGLGAGYDFGLARYTTRGRLDPTFGVGGRVLTEFGSG
jgi:uncharacterized delta-60 repeat protein